MIKQLGKIFLLNCLVVMASIILFNVGYLIGEFFHEPKYCRGLCFYWMQFMVGLWFLIPAYLIAFLILDYKGTSKAVKIAVHAVLCTLFVMFMFNNHSIHPLRIYLIILTLFSSILVKIIMDRFFPFTK